MKGAGLEMCDCRRWLAVETVKLRTRVKRRTMAALVLIGRLWLAFLDEEEEVDEAQRFPSFAVLDDDHATT
jgi:hypothetical protein